MRALWQRVPRGRQALLRCVHGDCLGGTRQAPFVRRSRRSRCPSEELRDVLFRTENERRMLVDALSRTQKRGTELLEETRALKSEIDLLRREVVLARRPVHGPCGNEAPGQLSSLAGLHCELPWGHEGWHQSGESTWTHGEGNQENLREGSAVRIPGVGE